MINFHNILRHDNIPFEDYLKLPGYSTSFLKREVNGVLPDFVSSDKVRVGSLVDSILTSPKDADMSSPLYKEAKAIAFQLREVFGDMLGNMVPQVSYTGSASLQTEGGVFTMPIKGRLDLLLPKLAVIDLKVTYATNIPALIDFMKYEKQMWLYCNLSGVKKAYLLIYCVPKKTCTCHYVSCEGDSEWWEERVLRFGKVGPSPALPVTPNLS